MDAKTSEQMGLFLAYAVTLAGGMMKIPPKQELLAILNKGRDVGKWALTCRTDPDKPGGMLVMVVDENGGPTNA